MSGYTAGVTDAAREHKLPRTTGVKNKQAAPTQITAEQILRESKALIDAEHKAPTVKITDPEELAEYRLSKRKEFEDNVRRVGRWNPTIWVKYATWEEQQKDFRRARSVWERALETDYRNVSLWLKYVEMEMRHRFINHARNIWDRAVSLLPRIDQLWYKYIHMEEMLGNVAGARQIFERWMQWEPDHHGWMAYVKMELRYGEVDRARQIFERYVKCLPSVKAWVRYAKFEMQSGGDVGAARACYERAIEELGEDANNEELFLRFAEFEEKVKEVERARAIYKYALDHLPKSQAGELYRRFVQFEKQQGDREGIEEVIVSERRFKYEEEVRANPLNYDGWFDYIRLEESAGDIERTREVYERAISNVPPAPEKRYWQRYVYLWIKYALFEELEAEDGERAREVYRACLKLIPHKLFTFGKIWIMAAQFEVRQLRLDAARKILGMAIGMCPKDKLFKSYTEMELQLGNIERCRTLYQKYIEWSPANAAAWGRFADLERSLGESERARAVYELAIAQPVLDMPEVLWKAYIDFEIGEGNREGARELYERLLQRTRHVKVWLSYAKFEATPLAVLATPEDEDEARTEEERAQQLAEVEEAEGGEAGTAERETRARRVYERAFRGLRDGQPDAKEEAVMLLEAWRTFEAACTSRPEEERARAVAAVEGKMPRRVKRKRPIVLDDGSQPGGMEEYYDYIFPDEAAAAPNLKLLEMAHKWKRQKMGDGSDA
ncbi:Crooked neck 1 [Chlorella sorokiniana]|uniref:Crooked neck 1 n=1 Tax=Chlorella sorokiniana TaxID=3076 RepID=A0A2P6TZ33_CHLSO|nr:Crooked neck 1 [Chlorella sorokiniana]|eukprot:PRW59332.1 Crooked neck 1 [Chlorella sorokiniana]